MTIPHRIARHGRFPLSAQPMVSGANTPLGFTLLELLTVLALLAILASLLLPALSKARAKVQGVTCSNNLRQLQSAMLLYASDNSDFVVWNMPFVRNSWVYSGQYGRSLPDVRGCTNTAWLVSRDYSAFAHYLSAPSLYRCPTDRTTVSVNGRRHVWSRSYGASFLQRKMTDFDGVISHAGEPVPPSNHRTFDEVHPGYLRGLSGCWVSSDGFVTTPASRHPAAAAFAFVDGHVELRRWKDQRTRRPLDEDLEFCTGGNNKLLSWTDNVDARWLCDGFDSGVGYSRQDYDIAQALTAGTTVHQ